MERQLTNRKSDEDDVVRQPVDVLRQEQGPSAASNVCLPANHLEMEENTDVRETMRRLPAVFQPLLTWLTGKPLQGQQPPWRMTAVLSLLFGLLQLFGGVAISRAIAMSPPMWWPLLLVSWMVTVGGARKIQVTIIHHCVHYTFSGDKRHDMALAEALSTLLLIQDATSYRYDHVSIHHSKKLATLSDPDLMFLLFLGFRPGMTRAALWKQMGRTLFSPRFHYLFLRARLAANFKNAAWPRRLMALIFIGVLTIFTALANAWMIALIALIIPLTVLYQISALLQFTCEHRWLRVHDPADPARLVLARLTAGRFMGEPAPAPDLPRGRRIVAWARWTLRMALIHLPFRVFVIAGDLPQHDWHHRHINKEWPNAAYVRQHDLENGCPSWPEPYSEIWGLLPAIDEVFRVLSSVPPLPDDAISMPAAEMAEVLHGM